MTMINILLAEEQKIIREGIKSLLNDSDNITISAEAKNGKEVVDRISEDNKINLAILDLHLPISDGIETTKYIKKHHSNVKVLILSMADRENDLLKGLEAGADGFLLKNTGKDELLLAINRINDGENFICSGIACIMMQKIKESGNHFFNNPSIHLSEREMQILQLIGQGFTNSEIADKIFTSRRTVESHRKKLIEKANAKNTATLIRYAVQNGLLK
jgi:DNA-binding NarL/FixJ family response regulator